MRALAVLAVGFAVAVNAAAAQAASYIDRAGYLAANGVGQRVSFEGFAGPGSFVDVGNPFTIVNVSIAARDARIIGPTDFIGLPIDAFIVNAIGAPATLTFSERVDAFGVSFASFGSGRASQVTASIFNGDVLLQEVLLEALDPIDGTSFFGLDGLADVDFTSIRLSPVGEDIQFLILTEVFSVSSASPAPEPAVWALMISGFGLTGACLRRRRMAPMRA
jgi:hypothetical protein